MIGGAPLTEVLARLIQAVEQASADGMLGSVLLLSEDGQHLRHAAAPSLPASYNATIDGVEIGPEVGSCGSAAYLRERVVVADIATDRRWVDFADLAREAGLAACWSSPMLSRDGELLGTFALYYRRPRSPSPADLAFVDVMLGTVVLIVEHSRGRQAPASPSLHAEAAQRLALELAVTAGGVGTFDWNLVTGELTWDEQLFDMFGFVDDKRRTLTIDDFFEAVHPGDRDRVGVLLQRAIDDVGAYDAEYRIVLPDGTTRWVLARGRALPSPDGTTGRLLGAAQDTTARRDTEARIARVMDSLSTAFFFLDREWRFSFLNAEAARVLDRPRDELLGRSLWQEFPAAIGSDFETYYRHATETGEPVAFDAHYPDPLNAWFEVRAWPNPDGLAVYFIDVTERRAAHREAQRAISRAGLLARVTEELAQTLDAGEAMQRLAELVVPAIGDWCVVTLIDDDHQVGSRRGLSRSLGWHSDPGLRPAAQRYAVSRLAEMTDHALIVRAVETADPQLHNADAMSILRTMFAPDAEPLRILEELDTYAIAVLPLIGQEAPVGMLSVVNNSQRGSFTDEDIDLLREMAARAGLVLDRGRLYRQQRQVAEGLQRSLLTSPPERPDRLIAVRYVPAAEVAQVGGDWYDALDQPDGSTVLVIGDVMGHDLLAAAAMGEVRMLVRTLAAQTAGDPAQVLSEAERVMNLISLNTLATVLVGRLEPAAEAGAPRRLRFCNAGHPPPLIVPPDGRVQVLASGDASPLLGVGAGPRGEQQVDLVPGTTVVLYTDGLVERRDQSIDEGIARLSTVLAGSAGADPEALCDAVLADLMPERPQDDVALLAVRI